MNDKPLILLTGATGYIGGRLLRALEGGGHRVRCLARRPDFLLPRVNSPTEVVEGDVLDPDSLRSAMRGVHTAYYLVHSMGSGSAFAEVDRCAARCFAQAARDAGVRRIIYLGGLGGDKDLSPHLASRQETGQLLRQSGVPTVELRASIIIGSGSLSFEMVRTLVEKLPVMITPRWVRTQAQPIAVEDVIAYLVAALTLDGSDSGVFEIGGADQVSYMDLMREYARQRGLHRWMIPVPVLTPWLSSLWLGLVTPVYARVGRELIEGVKNETVVQDDAALRVFSIRPRSMREAIARALANEDEELAATRWSDALSSQGAAASWGGLKFGSRIVDSRTVRVKALPEIAFKPVQEIGGKTGWYFANPLWQVRGFLDLLVGGVGLRRGRRHPRQLTPGDALDFWRVEAFEPGRLLCLFAEMKLPGRAWLQFEVEADEAGSILRQTAIFDPLGVAGLLYWYVLYPVHRLIFAGMLRSLARSAEAQVEKEKVAVTTG